MGGGFQIIELILLAMIAGFIALRLRSVLGKRMGHENQNQSAKTRDKIHSLNDGKSQEDAAKNNFLEGLKDFGSLSLIVKENLKRLYELEPGFDLSGFMEGSKNAYPMILEGFWAGRMDGIKAFLNDAIYVQFKEAVDAREKKGLVVESKVIEIRNVKIKDVQIKGKTVEITLEFKTDIISVTKDRDGKLVEGDLSDAVDVVDVWTFVREIGNQNPNWTLVETMAG
ncbi:MAG: Tim44/TimA family putative adaptor protein [Sphingomonadales bacterium]